MNTLDFEKLPVHDFLSTKNTPLAVGDHFVTPKLRETQDGRKAGHEVTYYKVIEVKENNNIVYSPVYDVLEEK